MEVSAWNDDNHFETGAGYGIRISKKDRHYFNRNWTSVRIRIQERPDFTAQITESFWRNCHEIRDHNIGKWFISLKHRYWRKYHTPKFELIHLEDNLFELREKR